MIHYICDHANKFPQCKKCIHSKPHKRQEIVIWIYMHDANYWCNEHTACDPDILEDTPRWHRPRRKQNDRTCRTKKEYEEIGLRKVKCEICHTALNSASPKWRTRIGKGVFIVEDGKVKEK